MDNVIGILHTKDVVTDFISERPRASLAALLKPIVSVVDTMPADRLLAFLRERRSHQALVVDAAGSVVGLITLEDVVAELLGGVSDEFKTTQVRAMRLSDGRVRLPGAMRLDQAALILARSGEVARRDGRRLHRRRARPSARHGERLKIDGLDVEIEAVEDGAVIVGDRLAARRRKASA